MEKPTYINNMMSESWEVEFLDFIAYKSNIFNDQTFFLKNEFK